MLPAADPLPLPAPALFFKLLLVATFLLHVIPMNAVLGGNVVVFVSIIKGKKNPGILAARMGRDLSSVIPVFISWAITLGIAPLLFVQVLYGQFFYTSSILIGWYWYGLLGLLLVGYYSVYILREKWESLGGLAPFLSLVICCLFLSVGYLWTTNITLGMLPGEWASHYFASPFGNVLFRGDSQLLPRFLHFFTAAIAVTGVIVAAIGKYRHGGDREYSTYLIKTGSRIFLGATVAQVAVGLWFLLSLPKEKYMMYLGGSGIATGLFVAAGVFGLAALGIFSKAARKGLGSAVGAGIAALLCTLVCMAVMRQVLREAYIDGSGLAGASALQVSPQWGTIAIFAVTFLWGIFATVKLIALYARTVRKSGTIQNTKESSSE